VEKVSSHSPYYPKYQVLKRKRQNHILYQDFLADMLFLLSEKSIRRWNPPPGVWVNVPRFQISMDYSHSMKGRETNVLLNNG